MQRTRRSVAEVLRLVLVVAVAVGWHAVNPCGAAKRDAPARAGRILRLAGVEGGLIVHLGCDDGRLTAALRAGDRYLVHGLDTDEEQVKKARRYLRSRGLYGDVTVEHWAGGRLPYVDNLAQLVIVEDSDQVPLKEVMRVLAPRGVACIRRGGGWVKRVKPWPEDVDEWTHYLHGPDNNAVSRDRRVGPPRHLQWVGAPEWCRSHDHLSSISAVVSAGGRIFYIADEGPPATVAFPSEWHLVARDAFSGVLLWKKTVSPWTRRLRGFRSGPPDVARRLVTAGDRVYVTLGYDKPVSAIDAATGEVLRRYDGTAGAEDIIWTEGILYLVVADPEAVRAAEQARRRGDEPPRADKKVMAVRASTGRLLWERSGGYVMPTTLAVSDGRVFYENTRDVVCLDAASGERLWRASRPISRSRLGWSTPTLVVQDGVVYSADRDSSAQSGGTVSKTGAVEWVPSSKGGNAPVGKLFAFSVATGEEMWSFPCQEIYNAPVDVLISNGLLWTGNMVRAHQPGITEGRNPLTGEVEFTRPPDGEFFNVGMGHHRCYRNKATEEYLLLGRAGVELIDVETGEGMANHWVRGACQYGIMPANGLLYAPPHSCACFIKAKLTGFNALSSGEGGSSVASGPGGQTLQRGPAYGGATASGSQSAASRDEWPTFRHDPSRSGRAGCSVPQKPSRRWESSVGRDLTAPVVADGRVFVASKDDCTVHALDADDGSEQWSFTAGARVDSPPTIYRGKAIFGAADGSVYCLRASDGELVWRFQAAPARRKVVAYDRVESTWPVHGSVLVLDGVVYFAAGRSSFLDGGIYLYGLDPDTGEKVLQKRVCTRDPETGGEPRDQIRGLHMPGVLPDVLSTDGKSIFMRHKRFDTEGNELEQNEPHLFSSVGFLDDSWWHRTYWFVGTQMGVGWGGWPRVGQRTPSGRIMVLDGERLYGFGRNKYTVGGSHVGLGDTHYELFATRRQDGKHVYRWKKRLPFWTRAMVLADDTLFVAGPPVARYLRRDSANDGDESESGPRRGPWYGQYDFRLRSPKEAAEAWYGRKGGALWAVSAADGDRLGAVSLENPPVFDGMIAAGGRLYVCTTGGQVLCLGR